MFFSLRFFFALHNKPGNTFVSRLGNLTRAAKLVRKVAHIHSENVVVIKP